MLANWEQLMDSNSVTSVMGVIALTCIVVSQIKMWLGNVPGIRAIPLLLVAIGVALGITCLAHVAGYLQGDISVLLAQTAIAALGSSGLYNVVNLSSLQRMDITKTAPLTRGDNSVRLDEVNEYVDATGGEIHDHVAVVHDHTPEWPAALLFVLFSLTFVISGCNLLQQANKPIDPLSPEGRYYQAKQDYLSVLEFFTFLRDQHVVTQQWMNEQKPYFDAAQSALKIWALSLKEGEDTTTAEQKFKNAASVLRMLREQYEQGPSTQPAKKVSEYDDRGNPIAGRIGPDDRGPMYAGESRTDRRRADAA
jgi:hypothetical protein